MRFPLSRSTVVRLLPLAVARATEKSEMILARALFRLLCANASASRGSAIRVISPITTTTISISIRLNPARRITEHLPGLNCGGTVLRPHPPLAKAGGVPADKAISDNDLRETSWSRALHLVAPSALSCATRGSVDGEPPHLVEEGAEADAEQTRRLAAVAAGRVE